MFCNIKIKLKNKVIDEIKEIYEIYEINENDEINEIDGIDRIDGIDEMKLMKLMSDLFLLRFCFEPHTTESVSVEFIIFLLK
jgi:hypothetical protein